MSKALTGLGVLLLAVLLMLADANRPGPNADPEKVVFIPRGAGISQIARQLQAEGIINNALSFRVAKELYASRRTLKAGEYAFPAEISVADVVNQLADGKVVLHAVTAAEGLTSAMIVDILRDAEVLMGDVAETPPEGSLLPETYRVERGQTRASVLAKMAKSHDEALARLWAQRAADLPIRSPKEAVILASIVEKETGVAHERPKVAAVFVNRLRKGMKLESDPTIIYGISQGRPLGRGIRRSELDKATPYNTYKIVGLPPTPICNPGLDSLKAVLNPPKTNDLFFVADGTGGHAFAATNAEHVKNVAKWRALERARAQAPAAP